MPFFGTLDLAVGLAGATAMAAAVSGRAEPVAAAYLAVNAVLALAATAVTVLLLVDSSASPQRVPNHA